MANLEAYGNRVVGNGSSGGGGLTQEEHDWLENLAAYEPNMYDINPNLVDGAQQIPDSTCYSFVSDTNTGSFDYGYYNKIPVCGYKRIKIWGHPTYYSQLKYRFQLTDVSFTSPVNLVSGWSNWITIPENAVGLQVGNGNNTTITIYYSLSASES